MKVSLNWLRDYVEPTRPRLDLVGWFLASVALLALLIAFAQADQWHWLSLRTLCLLVLAAVALWALIAYERRTPSPLLALETFSSPGFVLTMAIIGLGSIAYLSRLVFVPLQLISLRGLSPPRSIPPIFGASHAVAGVSSSTIATATMKPHATEPSSTRERRESHKDIAERVIAQGVERNEGLPPALAVALTSVSEVLSSAQAFDERIDTICIGAGNRDADPADDSRRQTFVARDLSPGVATVS